MNTPTTSTDRRRYTASELHELHQLGAFRSLHDLDDIAPARALAHHARSWLLEDPTNPAHLELARLALTDAAELTAGLWERLTRAGADPTDELSSTLDRLTELTITGDLAPLAALAAQLQHPDQHR